MTQIHEKFNLTKAAADFGLAQDQHSREYAVALLKATYFFSDEGSISQATGDQMLPVFLVDEFYDQPDNSSLRCATDVVVQKPGSDIAVLGHAYGRGRSHIQAGFRVEHLEKRLDVFGKRHWIRGMLASKTSKPEPFDAVPLKYEFAFGGFFIDKDSNKCNYPQNPIGKGFAGQYFDTLPAPSLEDPTKPIKSIRHKPPPANLGFIPPGWAQRAVFAGTFDQVWFDTRRPLFPKDFDERFFNAVPQDQVFRPKLKGGETIRISHLHPRRAQVDFRLPTQNYVAVFRIKDRTETIPMVIDTLLIEPDASRFSLSYRASCAIGNDIKYLRSIMFKEV